MELRGGELVFLSLIVIPWLRVARAAAGSILSCDVTALEPCGDDEQQVCNATSGACQCLGALFMVDGRCRAAETGGTTGAAAAGVAAVIVALALVTAALVLLLRRYPLVKWAREQLARRSQSNAYEDVMIGADDPPLTL